MGRFYQKWSAGQWRADSVVQCFGSLRHAYLILGKKAKFEVGNAVAADIFHCTRPEAEPLGHHRQTATQLPVEGRLGVHSGKPRHQCFGGVCEHRGVRRSRFHPLRAERHRSVGHCRRFCAMAGFFGEFVVSFTLTDFRGI
jgi:hypothetical protein